MVTSPKPDAEAAHSGHSHGIFDAALSHGKDPMKIFAKQLTANDEYPLSGPLMNTLSHIMSKMGDKAICESKDIETEDGPTFGLLSGTFFPTHNLSLYVIDRDHFSRQMSLVLTNGIVGENLFQEIKFPLLDLVTAVRDAASSVRTSFILFHLSETDAITKIETNFVENPLHLALLAIHGDEMFDIQVWVFFSPYFLTSLLVPPPKFHWSKGRSPTPHFPK